MQCLQPEGWKPAKGYANGIQAKGALVVTGGLGGMGGAQPLAATMAGAAFLALIAVVPQFITQGTALPMSLQYFLGGTSVLIVVGVF